MLSNLESFLSALQISVAVFASSNEHTHQAFADAGFKEVYSTNYFKIAETFKLDVEKIKIPTRDLKIVAIVK